jgi:hypothetical protein
MIEIMAQFKKKIVLEEFQYILLLNFSFDGALF